MQQLQSAPAQKPTAAHLDELVAGFTGRDPDLATARGKAAGS